MTESSSVEEPAAPVGATLARRRAARGLTLEEAAAKLKFGPKQLEALEQDRYDSLPRGTFLRGMVRSYARLLDVDPQPLLGRIAGQIDLPDADQLAARYREPVPFSDPSKRLNVVYAVLSLTVLVIAGVVAFEWQSANRREGSGAQASRPAKAAEVAASRPRQVESTPAPVTAQPQPDKAAQAPEKAAEKPPEEPLLAKGAANRAENEKARERVLRFRFDRESWVQVRDGAGHVLMSQLNPQGTESTVEGQPPFSLVIGNAQHVRVVYQNEAVDLAPHIKVEVARFTLP